MLQKMKIVTIIILLVVKIQCEEIAGETEDNVFIVTPERLSLDKINEKELGHTKRDAVLELNKNGTDDSYLTALKDSREQNTNSRYDGKDEQSVEYDAPVKPGQYVSSYETSKRPVGYSTIRHYDVHPRHPQLVYKPKQTRITKPYYTSPTTTNYLASSASSSSPTYTYGPSSGSVGGPSVMYGPAAPVSPPSSSYGPVSPPSSSYGPVSPPPSSYGPSLSDFSLPSSPFHGIPFSSSDGMFMLPMLPQLPKLDINVICKILLKLVLFKMAVKFIAVVCLLLFLPSLTAMDKPAAQMGGSSDSDDSDSDSDRQFGDAQKINRLTQLVWESIDKNATVYDDDVSGYVTKVTEQVDEKTSFPRLVLLYAASELEGKFKNGEEDKSNSVTNDI